MENKQYQIQKFLKIHVHEVVNLHILRFQNFFLTSLGNDFLNVLYAAILEQPGRIAYVALDQNNRVIGFVVGVDNSSGLYLRIIRQNFLKFFRVSFLQILRRPSVLLHVLAVLLHKKDTAMQNNGNTSLLMSLAVSEQSSSRGLGKALVSRFADNAKERNCGSVVLTTDALNNDGVNAFYEKCGFHVSVQQMVHGRLMNTFVLSLKN